MEKKRWRKVGDGEGVSKRVFQKPVKVFPFANTGSGGCIAQACKYAYINSIQYFELKIHSSSQQHNFDLTHSLTV